MKNEFDDLGLTSDQKVWVGEVYSRFDSPVKPSIRTLRVALADELPSDFDPYSIDFRILHEGTEITLLGIWLLDRSSPWLAATHRIITYIRQKLLENPDRIEFTSKEIAQALQSDEPKVAKCLNLMGRIRMWSSMSGPTDDFGVKIEIGGEKEFNKYFRYREIAPTLATYFAELAPNKNGTITWTIGTGDETAQYGAAVPSGPSYHVPNTAFILMWMDERRYPGLQDVGIAIKEVCAMFGIAARRADDIEHAGSITDVVLKAIRDSEFLIADLTGARPNVYYEIGYAHAIGKRPILFRTEGTPLHFDLAGHNVPEYRNTTSLKELLTRRFEAMLGRKAQVSIS